MVNKEVNMLYTGDTGRPIELSKKEHLIEEANSLMHYINMIEIPAQLPDFKTQPQQEQKWILTQLQVMKQYHIILVKRIENIKE